MKKLFFFAIFSVLIIPSINAGKVPGIEEYCAFGNNQNNGQNITDCESIDVWGLDKDCKLSMVKDGIADCKDARKELKESGWSCEVSDSYSSGPIYKNMQEACRKNLSFWEKIKLWFKDVTRQECKIC